MRGVRVQFELGAVAVANNWRYSITLGDGTPGPVVCLANPNDQYSRPQWANLLGKAVTRAEWATSSSEGMYITFERQVPNPGFDFTDPRAYEQQGWLKGLYTVDDFRILNPWIGRPMMSWYVGARWTNHYTYSEGDTGYFKYLIDDYYTDLHETGQYRVHRLDDSSNYKEFIIVLGV